MELFSLVISTTDEHKVKSLYGQLLNNLQKGKSVIPRDALELEYEIFEKMTILRCQGILPKFELQTMGNLIYQKTARVIADYILEVEENKWLRKIIGREFYYFNEREIRDIGQYCRKIIDQQSMSVRFHDIQKRKQQITKNVDRYLQEYSWMNIDGFIEFRLKPYIHELQDTVHDAVDEYLMDQQYQEFISALKYFVCAQESKIPEAHVIHYGGGDFQLLNEQMHVLDPDDMDVFIVEGIDHETQYEDMIVSALINVSPEKITIHTREPGEQIIKTLKQIFENRAEICNSCHSCRSLLGESAVETTETGYS